MSGRNTVNAPTVTKYTIKVVHTYVLATLVNEKLSRFLSIPEVQVIPNDEIDPEGREHSTRIERGLNVMQSEMERLGDGAVWDRVLLDAILLDGGVERIDRSPRHFWPELVAKEGTADQLTDLKREAYKKEMGIPIRATYVPLEYVYPIYDGSFVTQNFEYEIRSLESILRAYPENSRELSHLREDRKTKDLYVLHVSDAKHHAIYAMLNNKGNLSEQLRNNRELEKPEGELIYLDSYEHKLGRVPYNFVSGRFGGWKTSEGGIVDIGKGILHHNEILDELATQVYTNIRATKWPAWKFYVDPEKRGFNEKGPPKPPVVAEGGDITMYVGEDLQPLQQPQEDPVVSWFYTLMQGQLTRLGGNPALFGESQPGVRTGYQQALQISEAEGVDAKLESHLAQGVVNRATLIALHIRALNEEVYCHYTQTKKGKKTGSYIRVDPEDLTPMPRFEARVRKPRPVDFIAAIRAAIDASSEREGKGPLLSDDTILSDILAREAPDIEYKKKLMERGKIKILESGLLEKRVGDALNIKMAQESAPQIDPNMVPGVDPALIQAIQMIVQQSLGQGGINPATLNATVVNPNQSPGMRPGPVATDPQPENRIGEEVNRAESL